MGEVNLNKFLRNLHSYDKTYLLQLIDNNTLTQDIEHICTYLNEKGMRHHVFKVSA